MENEKNNEKGKNIVIGILLGIIICLVIALIFVSYNKFIVKNDSNATNDNNKVEEKKEDVNNNQPEEEQKNDNSQTQPINDLDEYVAKIEKEATAIDAKVSYKILNNDNLSLDIDYIKSYKITLSTNGKIIINNGVDSEKEISNISNAKNIYYLGFGDRLYILLNNGDVYKYLISDFEEKKYIATKVDEVKNATNFVIITINYKNAGADHILGSIDSNNNFIRIDDIAI